MKRWLLIALLFCQALCGAKKPVAPDWTDAVKRETLFPATTFYTGFVSTRPQAGEDKSQAYERAKEMARAEAVSTIQVTVEETIERQIESQQTNADGVNTRDPYSPEEEGRCIYSGKPSHRRVVFARSY